MNSQEFCLTIHYLAVNREKSTAINCGCCDLTVSAPVRSLLSHRMKYSVVDGRATHPGWKTKPLDVIPLDASAPFFVIPVHQNRATEARRNIRREAAQTQLLAGGAAIIHPWPQHACDMYRSAPEYSFPTRQTR